ncbi:hypothetical protein [Hoeflea sp. 108]|jgi:hypothetical protein|nr:hypothetical protein [Hoeflea sp. 108]
MFRPDYFAGNGMDPRHSPLALFAHEVKDDNLGETRVGSILVHQDEIIPN